MLRFHTKIQKAAEAWMECRLQLFFSHRSPRQQRGVFLLPTMMSSHRKTRSSSACHGVCKRTKAGALTVSAGSSANTRGTTVERLFCSAREGVWWCFGELEGNISDIVSGTGVPWESISPLLVANKFLTPVVASTVKSCRVNVRLIDVFFNSSLSNHNCRLQITTMRHRGQTGKFFLSWNSPLSKSNSTAECH